MNDKEILLYNSLMNLHLLERAPKAVILHDLMGLQAQFSRNPQISLRLRASDYSANDWDGGLAKIWSHRGTIHVIREDELGLHLSARGYPQPFMDGAWKLSAKDQEYWSAYLLDEIRSGNDSRDGLKSACAAAGIEQSVCDRVFYGWGGLIQEMVWRGMIVCCTGTEKRYRLPKNVVFAEPSAARETLIRRYFTHYGPASVRDCAAYFGMRMSEIKPILTKILPDFACTRIDGTEYYHAGALQEGEIPPCIMIPGFDQMILGYRDRSRMIDERHSRRLTNSAGIVFPSLLLRGRIRARWKIDGERVIVTPFEKLLKKDEAAIRREVRRRLGIADISFCPIQE